MNFGYWCFHNKKLSAPIFEIRGMVSTINRFSVVPFTKAGYQHQGAMCHECLASMTRECSLSRFTDNMTSVSIVCISMYLSCLLYLSTLR